MTIYTIGHSTRTIEEFIETLIEYDINHLADVRTIPRSWFNPQFNSEKLARSLKKNKIRYIHIKELGGLRHSKKDSINLGWENLSFRGFADYMQTDDFKIGLEKIISLVKKNRIVIMCAESVPWRCHRSIIADALFIKKIKVIHIINKTNSKEHELTNFARVIDGKLIYPKD